MAVDADYYFAAGDLVSWGRGLAQMGEIMKPRASRMYVLPGNHESESDIADFCRHFGFTNFHGASLDIAGVRVAGLGYSSPTPFDTPGEYSEEEMATRLAKLGDPASPDLPRPAARHPARPSPRRPPRRQPSHPRFHRIPPAPALLLRPHPRSRRSRSADGRHACDERRETRLPAGNLTEWGRPLTGSSAAPPTTSASFGPLSSSPAPESRSPPGTS